jgi:NAD(P)-dependent dehydrogenase (short-subunit alcohol dehydrogenase family)
VQQKFVAVTGAAGSLGSALTVTLKGCGFAVIGIDQSRDLARTDSMALALAGVDLTSADMTRKAFERITAECGSLAALVNLAGGFAWETIEAGSIETWDRLFNLNLRTAVNASQAALPLLLAHGGSIVNVGAAAAMKAGAGMGAYAASKSAVARLTESLAAEFLTRGVRVNAVLPSILDTPANRAQMPDAAFDRWVSTSALANVIAFLISDAAAAITGALIPVTGRVPVSP